MGFDIAIVTKGEFSFRGENPSQYQHLLNRGFCTMLMNAESDPAPVLSELEKCIEMDLSFLLEPRYHDPAQEAADLDDFLLEAGFSMDEDEMMKEATGWMQIAPFVQQVQGMRNAMREHPDYHAKMVYDRVWWHEYFGAHLQVDLDLLIEYLEAAQENGIHEFSFDIG